MFLCFLSSFLLKEKKQKFKAKEKTKILLIEISKCGWVIFEQALSFPVLLRNFCYSHFIFSNAIFSLSIYCCLKLKIRYHCIGGVSIDETNRFEANGCLKRSKFHSLRFVNCNGSARQCIGRFWFFLRQKEQKNKIRCN